jgi:hypothetical protein
MKKKTYMINHIPIKQVWLEENIILIKRCIKMGGGEIAKEPNEKINSLWHIKRPKLKNWVIPKVKR